MSLRYKVKRIVAEDITMNKKESKIVKNRFQNFSPQKKLDLSMQLYFSARDLKRAATRHFHPNWSEDKIDEEVRKVFLRART